MSYKNLNDAMLFLIGLGLSRDEISIGAIEAAKECELYADRYTSMISEETLDYIQEVARRKIVFLERHEMEEDAKALIERARRTNIAILTGGDPLIATTHKILFIQAKKLGVPTKVIHSNSAITTAISESGLDFYRFGKICTIPRWTQSYKPVSFYETIGTNLAIKAHSVLLLDYDSKEASTIPIREAITILEGAEKSYKRGIIKNDTSIMILNNLSQKNQRRIYTTIAQAKEMPLKGLNIIIIPSELSDIEKEIIDSMDW